MYIKLDGENIIGHIDPRHPGVNPGDWDAKVKLYKLVDDEGKYIYKYVGGELIPLTELEINNHPIVLASEAEKQAEKDAKNAIKAAKGKVDKMSKAELDALIEAIINMLGL